MNLRTLGAHLQTLAPDLLMVFQTSTRQQDPFSTPQPPYFSAINPHVPGCRIETSFPSVAKPVWCHVSIVSVLPFLNNFSLMSPRTWAWPSRPCYRMNWVWLLQLPLPDWVNLGQVLNLSLHWRLHGLQGSCLLHTKHFVLSRWQALVCCCFCYF